MSPGCARRTGCDCRTAPTRSRQGPAVVAASGSLGVCPHRSGHQLRTGLPAPPCAPRATYPTQDSYCDPDTHRGVAARRIGRARSRIRWTRRPCGGGGYCQQARVSTRSAVATQHSDALPSRRCQILTPLGGRERPFLSPLSGSQRSAAFSRSTGLEHSSGSVHSTSTLVTTKQLPRSRLRRRPFPLNSPSRRPTPRGHPYSQADRPAIAPGTQSTDGAADGGQGHPGGAVQQRSAATTRPGPF